MKNNQERKGYKVGTTAIIWAFATGMLAICIPLTAITKSGAILPLAVIIGASGSTISVWKNSTKSNLNKITQFQEKFATLETRIIDLETICSSQEFDAEQKFKKLESDRVKN